MEAAGEVGGQVGVGLEMGGERGEGGLRVCASGAAAAGGVEVRHGGGGCGRWEVPWAWPGGRGGFAVVLVLRVVVDEEVFVVFQWLLRGFGGSWDLFRGSPGRAVGIPGASSK